MKHFALLLRVQVLALLNSISPSSRNGGQTKHRGARVFFTALGYVLLAAIFIVYSALLAIGMAQMGFGQAIPAFAVLIGSLIGVVFTFMKANGTLFGLSDFDLVMSLPISRRVVVASRIAALFGSATVLGALFMLPMWIVYLIMVEASVWTALCMVISLVLAPAVPTTVAAFLAFCVSALASRFRHANLAYVIIGMVALVGFCIACYGFSFTAGARGDEATMAMMTDALAAVSASVGSAWPPAGWLAEATATGSALPLLGFCALSLAAPAAALEIMQRLYLPINNSLAVNGSKSHMSGQQLRARAGRTTSPFWAMVKKEYRALLGIPSYAFNCLFGYLLMLAIAVALAAVGVDNLLLSGVIDGVELDPETLQAAMALIHGFVACLLPWFFVFFSIASPSAACSISIEGRAAWVMATAPVSPKTILRAKLASNAIPIAACLVVSAAILLVSGQTDPLGAVQIVVTGFGVFYLMICLGMGSDARRPNFSWNSPNEIVKRGAPIMICVIGGMVVAFACGAACAFIAFRFGFEASTAFNLVVGLLALAGGHLMFWRTCKQTSFMLG